MDPAVEWLEAEFDANPHRVYGATGVPGVAWVRRLFELKREAHCGDTDPVCVCYMNDSDVIFAGSLPPMAEDELKAWVERGYCRRPESFRERQHFFYRRNGFKNNVIA